MAISECPGGSGWCQGKPSLKSLVWAVRDVTFVMTAKENGNGGLRFANPPYGEGAVEMTGEG